MQLQANRISILKDGEVFNFSDLISDFSFEFTFFKENVSSFITNIDTETILLANHQFVILATVNQEEYSNTYVCSPYGTYIKQAQVHKNNINNKKLKILVSLLSRPTGAFFKIGKINKTIVVNNSLATGSFHPIFLEKYIPEINYQLTKIYPFHAIMLPRINKTCNNELLINLIKNNYLLLPTGVVHLYDCKTDLMKNENLKSDLTLLKKSDYNVVLHDELTPLDVFRIHKLYELLFFKKHQTICPRYTVEYFIKCHKNRWYEFTALRNKEGVIDAFISSCKHQDLMVGGPSGYDIHKPKQLGFMRMLLALNLKKSYEEGCVYNAGASNDQFKRWRGSRPEIEYNAVYCEHLPCWRRIPWKLLSVMTNRILKPIFEKGLF